MISLHKCSFAKFVPAFFFVESFRSFKSHLDVRTLQGKAEARLLVLDEVERDFWITLLLQIRDDALSDKLGISYHVQHFVVLTIDESQFESVNLILN